MTEQERAELRRKIAEELGWRVEMIEGDYFELFDPTGERVTWGHLFSENEVWDTVLLTFAPSWTTSINAALTLPMNGKDEISLAIGNGAYTVAIDPVNLMQFVVSRKAGDPDTLIERIASDICAVWYEYRRVLKGMQSHP